MPKVIKGPRVGKQGRLALGCSAAVFDPDHQRILLIRRTDDGKWAVPGGYMEPGESLSEACIREVAEETGLQVSVRRLLSVFTNPHLLFEYADGNRLQLVVMFFEAEVIGGLLSSSNESTDLKYFTKLEIETLELGPLDRQRVADAFSGTTTAIIHDEF